MKMCDYAKMEKRIKETHIDGLYIIQGLNFPDQRGSLVKPFSKLYFDPFLKI